MPGHHRVYRFGPFQLDIRERRLSRDGEIVPLRVKVFDTLALLVENAGRLLTKQELLDAVWPGIAVEENNLNHTISVLRKTLDEKAAGLQYVETVPRVGYRFLAEVTGSTGVASPPEPAPPAAAQRSLRQEIRFSTAEDGVRIAYATVGHGPPLVKAANFLNHLEYEWESPVWRHWIHEISGHHLFVRYDERGCGLSDWQVSNLSFDAWVGDLETVVNALGLETFDLLGVSQGGAVAAAYAARHPDRVRRLILFGAFECGWQVRGDSAPLTEWAALVALLRLGWGRNNPSFRQIFTTRFIPEAGSEQMAWFDRLQQVSASPENAARLMEEIARLDVRPLLAGVRAPTIVFHPEGDRVIPFDEGRRLAAAIPGARFVPLASRNHLILEREPAWGVFLSELGDFLEWDGS